MPLGQYLKIGKTDFFQPFLVESTSAHNPIQRILDIVNKSNFESLPEHKSIRDSLKALHKIFVICPIDKAASNVTFVYKHFYASILLKELECNSINSNDDLTYISN